MVSPLGVLDHAMSGRHNRHHLPQEATAMIDTLAVFLASDGIDLSQYRDAFLKAMLQGFLLSWPVWVAVGLLFVGALALGTYKRIVRARSHRQR
jgi:hypothetical protein